VAMPIAAVTAPSAPEQQRRLRTHRSFRVPLTPRFISKFKKKNKKKNAQTSHTGTEASRGP
jgi:hypothetical protein